MGAAAKLGLVVVGVGGVGVLGLCVWGFGMYTDEVCAKLRAEPAIVEQLGAVTSCDAQILEAGDIDDMDTFLFEVGGAKGSGKVYVKSTSSGAEGAEEYQGILLVVGATETLIFGERPPTR